MVPEATLENGVPQTGGWFLVNARESRWLHNELGAYCSFEGKGEAAFGELGINLNVLPPGEAMAMYTKNRDRKVSSCCAASVS